ncbi:hypothetical protein BH10BDE1_BH10BDE1_10950 [soil metagenome]
MSFCATPINCYELPRALRTALFVGAFVLMAGLAYGRSPASPMPDVEMQRGLLAGSDALLERMVIPPNRPDWLLTDCGRSEARVAEGTSYDRMRHALCEAARKSNVAVRN